MGDSSYGKFDKRIYTRPQQRPSHRLDLYQELHAFLHGALKACGRR